MNKEVYLVDEGVLLTKNDREFKSYNSVYDKKYGYYDEGQYYVSDLETAIKDAKEYIENGVVGTYAIVSKSAINVDCIVEETPVEGETYFMDSVVYSVVKADDGVIENFFDKNFSIRQSEETKKQYQELSAAFERYIDMCSTKYKSGDIPYDMLIYPCDMLIYPLLHLPSYKDNVAVVFHNVYDNCNLIAYLKDGVLEIDNESGESIFDHNSLEKNGLTQNEAYYIKYGKLPQGHDEHDSDDMEQDL